MFRLALASVRHDRRRYAPIAIVVAIAGLMLLAQIAVAMGVFRDAAAPVARSTADLWAGPATSASLGAGGTLDPAQAAALWLIPELSRLEPYATRFGELTLRPPAEDASVWEQDASPTRFANLVVIDPAEDGMLYARHLPPALRRALAEPGSIVIGTEDAGAMGVAPGGRLFLDGRPMRVAGTLPGLRGLGLSTALIGPASLSAEGGEAQAAQAGPAQGPGFWLIGLKPGTTPARRAEIAAAIDAAGAMRLWEPRDLQSATLRACALESGAGTIFLSSAAVALVVAALVVNQTMSAAIAGAMREYAALRAFGLGAGRLAVLLLLQGGIVLALALAVLGAGVLGLLALLRWGQVPHALPPGLALAATGTIAAVVLGSNVFALRRLRAVDPAALLR